MGHRSRLTWAFLACTALSTTFTPAPAKADPVSVLVTIATAAVSASSITAAGIAAFSWTTFAINAALGLTLAAVSTFGRDQGLPSISIGANRTMNVREPIGARQTIYGRQRVGGKLIYVETTTGPDLGDEDDHEEKYLHMVFALAGHEVDGFEGFYVNDEAVPIGPSGGVAAPHQYNAYLRVKFKTGAPDQTAFEDLVAESDGKWTPSHRARGCALMYVRLRQGDRFKTGVPNFSVVTRGKRIRNLITGAVEWSQNAVWCAYDYLRTLGEQVGRFNEPNWRAEGAIAAETVPPKAGGTSRPRYTCNAVVGSDERPKSVLEKMTTTFAGDLIWTGGAWSIAAGAWRGPIINMREDDLRSGVKVSPRDSFADSFNGVKGSFVGPETKFIADAYPAVRSQTFIDVDGGEERYKEIDLPYTAYSAEAQRIAKIALYQQREQISVQTSFGLRALAFTVGDTITLSLPRFGWQNKTFRCTTWKFVHASDGEMRIDVTLRETSAGVYNWNAEEREFERNNTKLLSPLDSPAPTIALMSETRIVNEQLFTVLQVELRSALGTVGQHEVQYKEASRGKWISLGRQNNKLFEVVGVKRVPYDVRARSFNVFNVASAWSVRTAYLPEAFREPPPDVNGFDVMTHDETMHFTWAPVAAEDLSYYVMRWSPEIVGGSWQNSTTVAAKIPRPATSHSLPARSGTYFIKAVDKLGNQSVNPGVLIVDNVDLYRQNAMVIVNEAPTFTGTKTNCYLETVGNDGLVINQGVGVAAYQFANTVNLGAIYSSRVRARLLIERHEYSGILFDSVPGMFDARHGMFEAGLDGIDAVVQVATRRYAGDDWGPWQRLENGVFTAQYLRFRVVLLSDIPNDASPKVTGLSVTVDMPDYTESGYGVVTGTAVHTVTFPNGFQALKGVSITAVNMEAGDYYKVTSRSATGFNIRFYNSSGAGISREFDWMAFGVGRRIV